MEMESSYMPESRAAASVRGWASVVGWRIEIKRRRAGARSISSLQKENLRCSLATADLSPTFQRPTFESAALLCMQLTADAQRGNHATYLRGTLLRTLWHNLPATTKAVKLLNAHAICEALSCSAVALLYALIKLALQFFRNCLSKIVRYFPTF